MEDIFDFGFTAVDEEELSSVQEATTTAAAVEQKRQAHKTSWINCIMQLFHY